MDNDTKNIHILLISPVLKNGSRGQMRRTFILLAVIDEVVLFRHILRSGPGHQTIRSLQIECKGQIEQLLRSVDLDL